MVLIRKDNKPFTKSFNSTSEAAKFLVESGCHIGMSSIYIVSENDINAISLKVNAIERKYNKGISVNNRGFRNSQKKAKKIIDLL